MPQPRIQMQPNTQSKIQGAKQISNILGFWTVINIKGAQKTSNIWNVSPQPTNLLILSNRNEAQAMTCWHDCHQREHTDESAATNTTRKRTGLERVMQRAPSVRHPRRTQESAPLDSPLHAGQVQVRGKRKS